jgi:hypothetical protein
MQANQQEQATDEVWVQICEAGELDPVSRLASRLAILTHPDAQDCTFYRPDEFDEDAEEEDLGDAKVLFVGQFQVPAEWDADERAEFFGEDDPELFFSAFIECEAKPAEAEYFTAESGDYLACMQADGKVQMFYVYDYYEDAGGRKCVLISDDEELA